MGYRIMEAMITEDAKYQAERYLLLLNAGCSEEVKARLGNLISSWRYYTLNLSHAPLSNSGYLHEIAEMERFREIGIDPLGADISSQLDSHPEIHHEGIRVENAYLKSYLERMGVKSSMATVILLNPTYTIKQGIDNLVGYNRGREDKLQVVRSEIAGTVAAFQTLLETEGRLSPLDKHNHNL